MFACVCTLRRVVEKFKFTFFFFHNLEISEIDGEENWQQKIKNKTQLNAIGVLYTYKQVEDIFLHIYLLEAWMEPGTRWRNNRTYKRDFICALLSIDVLKMRSC